MSEYISLMTASMKKDFEFFSENAWPPSVENLRPYRERFGKGDFSVIVKIVDGSFSAYIEKMPSQKRDHQTRFMYYVVTAQGNTGDNEIAKAVKKIAAAAVSDLKNLGEFFDREFPTEYIAKFDDCRHTAETESEIQEKLIEIAEALPDNSDADGLTKEIIKIGSLNENKDQFCSALNILESETQHEGISLLVACCNTIKNEAVDFIKQGIENPSQGLILSDNNQIGKQDIVKKKMSSPDSSPLLNGSKWRTMLIILLGSLILNILLAIGVGTRYSTSFVSNLEDSLSKKESIISLQAAEIVELTKLKKSNFRDTIILDVESFVNSGLIKTYANTKDSAARYNYAFQVVSPDTIIICCDGVEIFHNSVKKLSDVENIDKMYQLFVDFNEKISQCLSAQSPEAKQNSTRNNKRGRK